MDPLVHRIQVALQQLKRNLEADGQLEYPTELTRSQMFMLYMIRQQGKCNATYLADKMEVKPSAITVMLDRVEKAGFVKRTHDTVDRRAVLLELTLAGQEELEKAIQARNTIIKRYLSRLEHEEVHVFVDLLEKLVGTERE